MIKNFKQFLAESSRRTDYTYEECVNGIKNFFENTKIKHRNIESVDKPKSKIESYEFTTFAMSTGLGPELTKAYGDPRYDVMAYLEKTDGDFEKKVQVPTNFSKLKTWNGVSLKNYMILSATLDTVYNIETEAERGAAGIYVTHDIFAWNIQTQQWDFFEKHEREEVTSDILATEDMPPNEIERISKEVTLINIYDLFKLILKNDIPPSKSYVPERGAGHSGWEKRIALYDKWWKIFEEKVLQSKDTGWSSVVGKKFGI